MNPPRSAHSTVSYLPDLRWALLIGTLLLILGRPEGTSAQTREFSYTYGGPRREESRSLIRGGQNTIYQLGFGFSFGPSPNQPVTTLLEVDTFGVARQMYTYGSHTEGYSLVAFGDRLAVAGRGFTSSNQEAIYLMIVDRQGQVVRQVAYRAPQFNDYRPVEIARCADGGFALAILHSGNLQSLIIKTDSLGFIQWAKEILTGGTRQTFTLKASRDGNLLIGGNTNEQCFLAKLNLNGQIQWDRRWGSNNSLNVVYAIGELSDGTIMTYGYLFWNEVRVRQLSRLSSTGQLQWIKGLGSTNYKEVGYGLEVDRDTSLILSGYSFIPGIAQSVDIRLSRVTTQGQVRWHKSFVGPGADQVHIGPNHTVALGQGHYLVGGKTSAANYEHPDRSVIVGFTDENDPGCNPPPNVTLDQDLPITLNASSELTLGTISTLTSVTLDLTPRVVTPCRFSACRPSPPPQSRHCPA